MLLSCQNKRKTFDIQILAFGIHVPAFGIHISTLGIYVPAFPPTVGKRNQSLLLAEVRAQLRAPFSPPRR